MTTVFEDYEAVAPDFRRYREQWENALLSQTLFDYGQGDDRQRRDLARAWFVGLFNGHAAHVLEEPSEGFGALDWVQASQTQFDLVYSAPYGARYPLGRVYEQPNGTWGALVIAGVKDDPSEAMAAAEWAVSRLSS